MKKILLATTVLVAASAAAHAEVTLSGDARMGVTAGGGADATISSRARVSFNAAGETDGGLSFGASFRADNAAGASAGTAGSVFISGAFGKLTVGDVDGASQQANGQLSGVGFTGLGDANEISYASTADLLSGKTAPNNGTQGTTDPSAVYEYSANGFTGYVSFSNPTSVIDNSALAAPGTQASSDLTAYAVGVKYATDTYFVGLGYDHIDGAIAAVAAPLPAPLAADNTDVDQITLTGGGTFGGASVKALYSARSGNVNGTAPANLVDTTSMGVSVDYTVSGVGLTAFALQTKDNLAATTAKAGGLGASYDLGGGAAFKAGIVGKTGAKPVYDAGLTFSF